MVYKNPEDNGFQRVKLSKKQHNALFPHRKITWKCVFDVYLSEDKLVLQSRVRLLLKMFAVIIFPWMVLTEGLKDSIQIYSDLFYEKEKGSFIEESIWANTDKYKQFITETGWKF
jgi:hypothetical protein